VSLLFRCLEAFTMTIARLCDARMDVVAETRVPNNHGSLSFGALARAIRRLLQPPDTLRAWPLR